MASETNRVKALCRRKNVSGTDPGKMCWVANALALWSSSPAMWSNSWGIIGTTALAKPCRCRPSLTKSASSTSTTLQYSFKKSRDRRSMSSSRSCRSSKQDCMCSNPSCTSPSAASKDLASANCSSNPSTRCLQASDTSFKLRRTVKPKGSSAAAGTTGEGTFSRPCLRDTLVKDTCLPTSMFRTLFTASAANSSSKGDDPSARSLHKASKPKSLADRARNACTMPKLKSCNRFRRCTTMLSVIAELHTPSAASLVSVPTSPLHTSANMSMRASSSTP